MAISLKDSLSAELAAPPAPAEKPQPVVVPIKPAKIETTTLARDPNTAKVTLYIPRKAYKYIKQKALEIDEKPHTLLMQAVDMWLMKHEGKTIAQLAGTKKK